MWYVVKYDGSYEPTKEEIIGINERKGAHVKGMCWLTKRFNYSRYEPRNVILIIKEELRRRTGNSDCRVYFMRVEVLNEFVVMIRTKINSTLHNICTEIGFDEIAQ